MDFSHVIRLIVMLVIWIVLYFLIRSFNRRLRYIFFVYFGILSMVFISGYISYYVKYDLDIGSISVNVQEFGSWVYSFSIFFVIPFVSILFLALYRFVKHFPVIQKIILGVIAIINAVILSYILVAVFMLIFFGYR